MFNRYYDPATGQFLSVDPLEAVTQAPYTYGSDDPLNLTDPTGLNDCWIFSGICDAGHVLAGGAKTVGHGAAVAGTFVYNHRSQFATGAAIGVCLVPGVDLVGCGEAQALAYGVRAQQRVQNQGFSGAFAQNAEDLIATTFGFSYSGLGRLGVEMAAEVGVSLSPNFVNLFRLYRSLPGLLGFSFSFLGTGPSCGNQ